MSTAYEILILAEPSVIAYWEMGETSGTTATDSVAGAHNGTIASSGITAPTLGQPGIPSGGGSILFNGNTTDHTSNISVPSFSIGGIAGFTIEAWVYIPSSRPGRTAQIAIFSTSDGGAFSGELLLTASNTVTFSVFGGSGTITSNTALTENTWSFIVVTVTESGPLYMYINGVLQTSTGTVITPYNLANALPFWIGGGTPAAFDATFEISNVAVFDSPLAGSDILTHYDTGAGIGGASNYYGGLSGGFEYSAFLD